MSKKVIDLLKNVEGFELTDELEGKIKQAWEEEKPDTDNLFTQKELDDVVEKRVARLEKTHEGQISNLEKEIENLIDPSKVKEYEDTISDLKEQVKTVKTQTAKLNDLKVNAVKAGVQDTDYFDYLVEKNGILDRLKAEETEDGNVRIYAVDKEGNQIKTEEGALRSGDALVEELVKSKPTLVSPGEKKKEIGGGGGNPPDKDDFSSEEVKSNTEGLLKDLGYKN